jgi:YgiT-type zinc finger domain-containing protein
MFYEVRDMTCDTCGKKGAKARRVSRSYGKGNQIVVIDNVPIVVCPHCGESYMTAETLREIERLKIHRKHVESKRTAPIISYV